MSRQKVYAGFPRSELMYQFWNRQMCYEQNRADCTSWLLTWYRVRLVSLPRRAASTYFQINIDESALSGSGNNIAIPRQTSGFESECEIMQFQLFLFYFREYFVKFPIFDFIQIFSFDIRRFSIFVHSHQSWSILSSIVWWLEMWIFVKNWISWHYKSSYSFDHVLLSLEQQIVYQH
jgi:hypothetical protein